MIRSPKFWDSDVLLYVSKHVLHVIVLRVARMGVVVRATPVSM